MNLGLTRLIDAISGSGVAESNLSRPGTESAPQRESHDSPLSLRNGQLTYRNQDLSEKIREVAQENPQALAALASEIETYRRKEHDRVAKQKRKWFFFGKDDLDEAELAEMDDELAKIFALCDAHLSRIGEQVKNAYDRTTTGISVRYDEDGQLLLNGLNVTMALKTYRRNPSPRSKVFLKGIRNRLQAILENRANNRHYGRMSEVVVEVTKEIDSALAV